jgi:hypothetical protein
MNWMRPSVRFTAVLPALLLGLCLAPDARSEDDRPEPMVFDLVDPLGATPGKTEINTLLGYSPRTGDMAWSPEIEFAFAKGHSIEFELPMENTTVRQYKVTLQGYFGELMKGRMLHGWQAGGRRINDEKAYAAEVLYLNDYKFSERWSMMNMLGVRHTAIGKSGEFIGLLNNTLFYSFSRRFSFGVELNSQIGARDYRYQLTPQFQYSIGENGIIQIGGGPSQLTTQWNEEKKTEWLLVSRLVYDF